MTPTRSVQLAIRMRSPFWYRRIPHGSHAWRPIKKPVCPVQLAATVATLRIRIPPLSLHRVHKAIPSGPVRAGQRSRTVTASARGIQTSNARVEPESLAHRAGSRFCPLTSLAQDATPASGELPAGVEVVTRQVFAKVTQRSARSRGDLTSIQARVSPELACRSRPASELNPPFREVSGTAPHTLSSGRGIE
jgi:hypothetical protein